MARLFRDAPEAIAETLAARRGADLLARRAALRISRRDDATASPRRRTRSCSSPGKAPPTRYPGRRPGQGRARSLAHELALIAELQYAPYFLTVHDIVRFARAQDILCQGRGSAANSAVCFCLGITEVDPEPQRPAVRALHLRRAQRAARHRRRFRARAARGGDPVHLRQIRPRARRHRRDRHLLSRPLGDPRGRQGVRPVGGRHRRAVVVDLGHGRRRGARDRAQARRHRRRQPAHARRCARSSRRSNRFRATSRSMSAASSSPGAGSTRWCRSSNAAMDDRTDRRMGQGRSRRARHPQGRRARARHADLHPQGLRARRQALR